MAQRDVGGSAGGDRKRDADQLRAHRVERIGFGVERGEWRVCDARDPRIEHGQRHHGLVVQFGWCGDGVCRATRWRSGSRRLADCIARLGVAHRAARRVRRKQFTAKCLQTVALEKLQQPFTVARIELQAVEPRPTKDMTGKVAIGGDRDEPLGLRHPRQRLAQVLADGAFHALGRGDHAVQRAVLDKPLHGRLRADLVDTGHVVDTVPDERQVVDDALRRHAELFLHAGDVEPLVRHRVDQRHIRIDELREILVAGRDDHAMTARRCRAGDRADRIVGLDAGHFEHRPAEQAHHLMDRCDLLHQGFGHRRTVRLVVGVPVVAKGRPLGVEHAGRVLGRELRSQQLHHRDKTVQRTRRHTARPAEVGQRVIRAVEVARPIDQQHRLLAHAAIVAEGCAARDARC